MQEEGISNLPFSMYVEGVRGGAWLPGLSYGVSGATMSLKKWFFRQKRA